VLLQRALRPPARSRGNFDFRCVLIALHTVHAGAAVPVRLAIATAGAATAARQPLLHAAKVHEEVAKVIAEAVARPLAGEALPVFVPLAAPLAPFAAVQPQLALKVAAREREREGKRKRKSAKVGKRGWVGSVVGKKWILFLQ
jgi:hypothetical protein